MKKYTWEDVIASLTKIGSTNLKIEDTVDVLTGEVVGKSILDIDNIYYWLMKKDVDGLWFVVNQGSAF